MPPPGYSISSDGKFTFTCNSKEQAAETIQHMPFGFWLLHGLGEPSDKDMQWQVYQCIQHFHKIERM